MKIGLAMFLNLFLIITLTHSAPGKDISKDYHESFMVSEGTTLHLTFGDGDVTITPWDKNVLDIKVKYRAKVKSIGVGGNRDFEVEFRESGNDIYVTGREFHSISFGILSSRHYEYRYTIRAPRYLILDLRGEDGDVEIEDWAGEIECKMDDGDLQLRHIVAPHIDIRFADGNISIEDLEGELEIMGDDGNISIENCKTPQASIELEDGNVIIRDSGGNFKIATDDGNVKMFRTHVKQMDIHTEDGRVDLDLVKSRDIDLTIRTIDGNVTVDLEAGISASFSIDTNDGRIRTALSRATIIQKNHHTVTGKLYGGEGQIRISTMDGNVTLRELR